MLQPLIAAGLIYEYRVWVFPVVLGKGKRLFENSVPPEERRIVEERLAAYRQRPDDVEAWAVAEADIRKQLGL